VARLLISAAVLLAGFAGAWADTLLTEARILEVTERGFILQVGTEPLGVEDSVATRLWKGCVPVKRDAFAKGEAVFARIKPETDPPTLREMADLATWKWLDRVRREPQKAVIDKIDSKYMTVRLEDGRTFAFRATDKSQVKLKNEPNATLGSLKAGMQVYVKGRLLPTLDTWLALVSDAPIESTTKSASSKAAPKKLEPLPSSGKIEGTVLALLDTLRMFDVLMGSRALHITYNLETKFFYEGRPAKFDAVKRDRRVLVHYKRDKAGRLVASKVELFPPGAP